MRSPAVWAVVAVLGLPALAEAQTWALPRLPIRRQRVACEAEPPVYRAYRQQYFGYFPTCWRRFPPGWGCPSPEAPNLAADLTRAPIDTKATTPLEGTEPGAGGLPPVPGADLGPGAVPPGAEIPLPAPGASPFDQDMKPPAETPLVPRDGRAPPPPNDGRAAPLPLDTPPRAEGPRTEPIPLGAGGSAARPVRPSPLRGLLAGLFGGQRSQ